MPSCTKKKVNTVNVGLFRRTMLHQHTAKCTPPDANMNPVCLHHPLMVTLSDANSCNACGITKNVCRGCNGAADPLARSMGNRLDEKEPIKRR